MAVMGCSSLTTNVSRQAESEWVAAYTSDFANVKTTEDNWFCTVGGMKCGDGKMVLTPGHRNNALAIIDALSFSKSVRVEVTGSASPCEKPEYLSFSICLNTDGAEMGSGYLLQFGAKGNTCSLLKRKGEVVTSTINKAVRPEAGKTYKIVAEKLDNRVSLSVDGAQVFSYTDPTPLEDPSRGCVGLFTWACSLAIDKVTIYTRKGHPEDMVAPMVPPVGGTPVTLRGILLWNSATVPDPAHAEHLQVLYAVEGMPEISAALKKMMQDCWPGDAMDCDQALRFNEEIDRHLKYYIAPGQNVMRTHKGDGSYAQAPTALTGVIAEIDGRKWIFPTQYTTGKKAACVYPAKMLAPDKPLAMPGKEPLILKISDKLALKCALLPAGRFVHGSPFIENRYQDEYPHEVVLTKPFWMAEIPVTREMFEAVMGSLPAASKALSNQAPQCAVTDVPFAQIETFCQKLSQMNNRKVRLPTDSEWEYAARVGTSSPCLPEKYVGQTSAVGADDSDGPVLSKTPVKSAQPNAWGLYDMETFAWQVVNDWERLNARVKEIDPVGPPMSGAINYGSGPLHKDKGGRWFGVYRPTLNGGAALTGHGAEGDVIFRIAVDATPEEIAGMEKAEIKPEAAGKDVTLAGNMMPNSKYTRHLTKEESAAEDKVPVLFAVGGTPEVTATFEDIMKDLYAGNSINYDQALKIEDEFNKRLKYYITPGELTAKKENQLKGCKPMVITGVVSEKDGKKWITPTAMTNKLNGKLYTPRYSSKLFTPDKPLQRPGNAPLVLKITDTLSLNCILLPAGTFMMGPPCYVSPLWFDHPPHKVTLTKPFFLAEIPVTQEMYEAIVTNNPSTGKGPQLPVRNVFCGDIHKFCQIVSEKNGGRKIRLPTQAEWEWACRVGTSNPPFSEKYQDQNSSGKGRGVLLPVKSKKPNAWGLYDMISDLPYEMTQDSSKAFRSAPYGLEDAVDEYFPTDCSKKHGHMGKGVLGFLVTNHEAVGNGAAKDDLAYGTTKFRILVEATPEEIAAMEKETKK